SRLSSPVEAARDPGFTRRVSGSLLPGDCASNESASASELAAAGERSGEGGLVGELEVSAHREALREPGDPDAHRLEEAHEVERGRLALHVRVRGDDDLLDLAVLEADEELLDAELLGADALQR